MAIIIKDQTQTTTILTSTTTIESGEWAPRVFFSRKGWKFLSNPIWTTNKSPQREGNFKAYNGSDDSTGRLTLYLSGSTRNTNLATLKALKEPIYLDASDIDSNDSGLYVLYVEDIERDESVGLITCQLKLEAYNN